MSSFVDQSALLDTRPVVVNNLNITRAPAGRADAAHPRRGAPRCSTSSGTRCTACSPTSPTRASPAPACRATSSSSPARSTRCGRCGRRSWPTTRGTSRPASRCRRTIVDAIEAAAAVGGGVRAPLEYLGARRCSTRPGTGSRPRPRSATRWSSRRRRWRRPASPSTSSRRATGRRYFQHIFAGGYSAGYYSYIWSEVLDADTVEWFSENGGLRRENGDTFRQQAARRRRLGRPAGRLPRRPRPGRRPRPAAAPPRDWTAPRPDGRNGDLLDGTDGRFLRRVAADTWRSMAVLTDPATGLPADNIDGTLEPASRSRYTSPTNIGALLWSTVAAQRLGLIPHSEAVDVRPDRTVRFVDAASIA